MSDVTFPAATSDPGDYWVCYWLCRIIEDEEREPVWPSGMALDW